MLIPSKVISDNSRKHRRLQHDVNANMLAIGCFTCPQRAVCGGLHTKGAMFDCMDHCCGKPASCDKVCKGNPDFANRLREVQGFGLDNVPRAGIVAAPALLNIVPVVFHGSRRQDHFDVEQVALPLYLMVNQGGLPHYSDRVDLENNYKISSRASIILTGTADDKPLEKWWNMGEAKRRTNIRAMIKAGVSLVTTPNYSLFTDTPRWDDLHSMKRIAITHQEFLSEGMPAALHVNGRTETDFLRWTDYISARPEVTHLAYEFTTGTQGRRLQHAEWLNELALSVGRPLKLVIRGGLDIIRLLQTEFEQVTYLETSAFMKTLKRQKAFPDGNARLDWRPVPTIPGQPLDWLLAENYKTVNNWATDLYIAPSDIFNKV